MNLYFCRYVDSEWGCFVIAESRNKAKHLFSSYWNLDGEYIDVRCRKEKSAEGCPEGVYDDDCDELMKLGVRYMTQEDFDKIFDSMFDESFI